MRLALGLALTCAVLGCAPNWLFTLLALDRQALAMGEVWRLWTGHLVHFSAMHAAADSALLFCVAAIVEREIGGWRTAAALLASAPLISTTVLWLVPDLAVYAGASALSAFLGVVAGSLIWRTAPPLRFALICMGAVTLAKMVCEAQGCLPALSSVPDGVRVVWQAHVIACLLAATAMKLQIDRHRPTSTRHAP